MKMMNLDGFKSMAPLHFIGIGGVGMSAIAGFLAEHGIEVQGSDHKGGLATEQLRKVGCSVFLGHGSDNLAGAKTVVISSAIGDENTELIAAESCGLRVLHRSDILAQIMDHFRTVAITGTHGKTTTSALIAYVAEQVGASPCFIGGGYLTAWNSNWRVGNSDVLIVECDESDGTISKYVSEVGVISNLERDHMDFYRDEAHQLEVFQQFVDHIRPEGCLLLGWDSKQLRQLHIPEKIQRLAYGASIGSDLRYHDLNCSQGRTRFSGLLEREQRPVDTGLLGKHNAQNILACLGVVRYFSWNIDRALAAISDFSGVRRRMEHTYVSKDHNRQVIDDYSHNPGKIEACILSLRESWKEHKILAVFQPHRFSRLRNDFDAFARSLGAADDIIVLPVFAAGEPQDTEYCVEAVSSGFAKILDRSIPFCDDLATAGQNALQYLEENPKSLLVTLGAGDVFKVSEFVAEFLKKQEDN
jgi:UDP-N-acetylmuramate--alanine ligase